MGVPDMGHWEEEPRKTQDMLEGLSAGPGQVMGPPAASSQGCADTNQAQNPGLMTQTNSNYFWQLLRV